MDVGCELNYSVHTKPTASAEQLSSGDEIWMYAQLTEQPDLAQFTAQVRTLLDSIDYASYPNFSASFYAQYPQGEFHLNLKDRTAMRLSTAELEKPVGSVGADGNRGDRRQLSIGFVKPIQPEETPAFFLQSFTKPFYFQIGCDIIKQYVLST